MNLSVKGFMKNRLRKLRGSKACFRTKKRKSLGRSGLNSSRKSRKNVKFRSFLKGKRRSSSKTLKKRLKFLICGPLNDRLSMNWLSETLNSTVRRRWRPGKRRR
jgi:hypothetical protein